MAHQNKEGLSMTAFHLILLSTLYPDKNIDLIEIESNSV